MLPHFIYPFGDQYKALFIIQKSFDHFQFPFEQINNHNKLSLYYIVST